jgi:glycerate 2-kinase
MNIIVAPDKFKGSIDAVTLCQLISRTISDIHPEANVETFPLADGGDGFAAIIKHYFGTTEVKAKTVDPLGRPMIAVYQYAEEHTTAYIEMAAASGLALLKEDEYDPMKASTYGTGLLIRDAIARGAQKIVLGIGGSATNDGGTGMADALGYMFLDKNEDPLIPCGEILSEINEIVMPETDYLEDIEFQVACDVKNPFYGPDGAAFVYAPQKGASEDDVTVLDEGLKHLDDLFIKFFSRSVAALPGAGAAGGLGGGCEVFLGARLISGVDHIIQEVGLEKKMAKANIIITGEGCFDEQSLQGKVVGTLARLAQKYNKRIRVICGDSLLTDRDLGIMGIESLITLVSIAGDKQQSIADPERFIAAAVQQSL